MIRINRSPCLVDFWIFFLYDNLSFSIFFDTIVERLVQNLILHYLSLKIYIVRIIELNQSITSTLIKKRIHLLQLSKNFLLLFIRSIMYLSIRWELFITQIVSWLDYVDVIVKLAKYIIFFRRRIWSILTSLLWYTIVILESLLAVISISYRCNVIRIYLKFDVNLLIILAIIFNMEVLWDYSRQISGYVFQIHWHLAWDEFVLVKAPKLIWTLLIRILNHLLL